MSTDLATYQPEPQTQTLTGYSVDLNEWAARLQSAHQIGSALCGTSFAPTHFRGKPDEAAAAILYGSEVGFTPTQALQNLYVIGGKPALYARPMVAIVQAAGHEVWTAEKSDESVTVCGRRRGSEHIVTETWTLARAQRAGYTSNKKYQTDPQAMLYARAASDVCRQVAADALAGMAYSVEELEMATPEQSAPHRPSGLAGVKAAAQPIEATVVHDQPTETGEAITPAQLKALHAGLADIGLSSAKDKATALAFYAQVIGRDVDSSKDMTKAEASAVLDEIGREKARDDSSTDASEHAAMVDDHTAGEPA